MRILRVIGSMNPASGGPCQGIRNSIPQLQALGVENEVVCFDEPTEAFLQKDGFSVHALGRGKGPWNYSPALIPWLQNNLHRFDAVIVHGLWLYHSHAVRKALQNFRKKNARTGASPKLFVMPHGMLDPYFQKARGRRLKALRNWIFWKAVEGAVINRADGVFFTCETELQLAREPFRPYHPKREVNVGYGITQPPAFLPRMATAFGQACPAVKNKPYLLFLSRIHEKKGVDLLLSAYAATVAEAEQEKALDRVPLLVIAGPGMDTPFGARLQQQVSDSDHLRHRVHFSGMLTGEAKWGAFYGSEAFVLPSHQENFGIAVAEALACGRPVLISNKVNIWREIEAAGAGLVAEDTTTGTTQLLRQWIALNADAKSTFRQNARACYEADFSIEPNVARLLHAIRQ